MPAPRCFPVANKTGGNRPKRTRPVFDGSPVFEGGFAGSGFAVYLDRERKACRHQGRALTLGQGFEGEALDLGLEQPMVIQLRTQVQEHRAEPHRCPVHEDEFLWHRHGSALLQGLVHLEGLPPPVFSGLDPIGHGPRAVLQDWAIDEPRPYVEDLDQLLGEVLEPPDLVGVDDPGMVVVEEAAIEIDHPADEAGWKMRTQP